MRVLFWSGTFWPLIGGVEVLAGELIMALRRRGHEFLVIAETGRGDLPAESEHRGVPVHRFPFSRALHDRDIDRVMEIRAGVAALRRRFEPDLVHVYWLGPDLVFERDTARAHPAPGLVTLHRLVPERSAQPGGVLGSTLRSAAWVSAGSTDVLDRARRAAPEIADRSSVILNSLALPSLDPRPLPLEPPRLLCLGRATRQKGFDLALEAFAAVVERFPTARLTVAGDGVERPRLAEQAARLGIAESVDFVGWVALEDVPALIDAATLVLMPSRHEGLPLVALQAAQMARPLVASRIAGLNEVVLHEETGLLVESENSHALAEAITRLLHQPELATRLGRAARRRAQEVFNWDRHVDAYDVLYRRLAGQAARS